MRRLVRVSCPPPLLAAGANELRAARLHFEGTGRQTGFTYKAYRAGGVKVALNALSNGKCAYCEADYDATHPSDVEHYRPKGAIDTDAGRIKPGYWWLAAAWDNLLPSCIRCNRQERQLLFDGTELTLGKANRFPLADEARRASAIGEEADEIALLIDPCCEDPSDYIRFIDDNGYCLAVEVDPDPTSINARKARASIDIYGLNRSGLVRDRSRYMRWAKVSLARLEKLARRLDRLPVDAQDESTEITDLIESELEYLHGLTYGEDRYTGMLQQIMHPRLEMMNIVF